MTRNAGKMLAADDIFDTISHIVVHCSHESLLDLKRKYTASNSQQRLHIMSDNPPIHLAGTQAFFPGLLAYIRNLSTSTPLPLDNVIFQSILLCLIAGDKHLILRTPEEDIGLAVKLTLWTLSSIFNLSTQKVKIRNDVLKKTDSPSAESAAFLRSLFLHNQAPQDEERLVENLKHLGHHRQQSSRSSRHKSRSIPNNLAGVAQAHGTTPSDFVPSTALKNAHAHTDPLPLPTKYHRTSVLPQALVISGLESASIGIQRSLSMVLAEKKVVIDGSNVASSLHGDNQDTWDLSDGFIAIYVCPWNARERPDIHKSLLDKFAMSTNVFISQSVRRDFQSLPFSPRQHHSNFGSYSTPGSPSPSYPTNLPPTHTPPIAPKPLPTSHRPSSHLNLPLLPEAVLPWSFIKALQDIKNKAHISHTLSLYLSDIFSAARHNSRLNGLLLTAKSKKDAEDLVRASRVIGNDLTGMELIRSSHMHHNHHQSDGDSVSDSESTDAMLEDYVRLTDEQNSAMSSVRPFRSIDEQEDSVSLDVSEVDIARIVPRVISHRVSLRSGPEDEILSSALFGATFKPPIPKTPNSAGDDKGGAAESHTTQMHSVKDVLVSILSEV